MSILLLSVSINVGLFLGVAYTLRHVGEISRHNRALQDELGQVDAMVARLAEQRMLEAKDEHQAWLDEEFGRLAEQLEKNDAFEDELARRYGAHNFITEDDLDPPVYARWSDEEA